MMKKACNACSVKKPIHSGSSWISALLIIIIPKCPFCVMAYSSAITICGASSLYTSGNNWVSYIPLALSAIIICMILLNWRGSRTFWSLIIAILGSLLILGAHQLWFSSSFYNWGTTLMFLAIFFNGPMFSLFAQFQQLIINKHESLPDKSFKRINHLS